jgi:protein-disulfide isomerase
MDGGATPTSHELRELKKQEKLAARQQQSAVAQDANKKKRTKQYALGALIILILGFGLWWLGGLGTATAAVVIGDHPVVGAADAPVQFVIFGDFQCPFTRRFWQGAFPRVLEKYSDKIQVAYWPVPTAKHNYDRASAVAAYCANEQGKFWEYAKVIFDRQGAATDDNLRDYARELQLDTVTFNSCFASGKYDDIVQEDYLAGRKFGVVQTPTVAINEHWLSGELPFEEYARFIDYELPQ